MLNFVYCMDGQEDFLTHVIESIQTPFYVIDVRDYSVVMANSAARAELNRRKTQLLANLSHDIRSPLASVLGFTEMLQGGVYGALTAEQQAALQNVSRSAEHLLNFVNNMLGHTQFEMGKLTVQSKQVLPTVLLASVEDVAAGAADLMNGRVTVESESGSGSIFTVILPLILAGDENC